MKNKKGFTLIELIVIIVLLGVIMVFALPNITSTLERNKKDKMILDAQDMVEKYKNYMLNFKIPGLDIGIYSALDMIISDTSIPGFELSDAYCSGKSDELKQLSIPLATLDKRGEIKDSPFGKPYIPGQSDYEPFVKEHSDYKVSYVYICVDDDDKTIHYKVCLTDEDNTLKADVLDLNGDNKYTKFSTGNNCNVNDKI